VMTCHPSVLGPFIPPLSDGGAPNILIDYNQTAYISNSTFEANKDFYSKFVSLGRLPLPDGGSAPVIGVDRNSPVAIVAEDSQVEELIAHFNRSSDLEVLPFILGVLAIDAALIGAMWAKM